MHTKHQLLAAALVGLGWVTVSVPAYAETITVMAHLMGSEEVPANDSQGMGMLSGTLDTETHVLKWTLTYSDLTGPAKAAHFHGPAMPGANAPIVVPFSGALDSPYTGTATLTGPQQAELLEGKWYTNIHTAAHGSGELRGQVEVSR